MKQYMKKNKVLLLLVLFTITIIIIGIFLPAILPNKVNKEIKLNIKSLVIQIKENKQSINTSPYITFLGNIITTLIIWSLGISIIGIPIIIIYYGIKSLYLSVEIILLLKNISQCNILFILIYSISSIINQLIIFILVYYACNYSIILIKTLFMKKEYKIKKITYNYFKILIIIIILTTVYSLTEIFIFPKLLRLVI